MGKKIMLLKVRVIPNAKKNRVKEENGYLKVYLSAPPIEGKANKMLIRILSVFFKSKKNKITIVKGEKSQDKLVEVLF
ncbi:DUF167 domain-containing protein [bacterium]|nr:DUF167 domain-containing protein [bacterium]